MLVILVLNIEVSHLHSLFLKNNADFFVLRIQVRDMDQASHKTGIAPAVWQSNPERPHSDAIDDIVVRDQSSEHSLNDRRVYDRGVRNRGASDGTSGHREEQSRISSRPLSGDVRYVSLLFLKAFLIINFICETKVTMEMFQFTMLRIYALLTP